MTPEASHWLEAGEKFLPLHAQTSRLMHLMLSSGQSEHRLLRGSGLFCEDLGRSGFRIAPEQVLKLTRNARKLIQDPELSFRWGSGFWPGFQGRISEALASAGSLREALQLLSAYRYQLSPLLIPRITSDQAHCYVQWLDVFGVGDEHSFLVEAHMSALQALTDAALPGSRDAWRFCFNTPAPSSLASHQVYLGDTLHFSAGADVMIIPVTWLDHPWSGLSVTQQSFNLSDTAPRMTLTEVMYEQLMYQLVEVGEVSGLPQMATDLQMSPATLKRRLSRSGVSYQKLQDTVRLHRVLYLMHARGWSNDRIAEALKSGGVANFRRVFRRWTGQRPAESREALRGLLGPVNTNEIEPAECQLFLEQGMRSDF